MRKKESDGHSSFNKLFVSLLCDLLAQTFPYTHLKAVISNINVFRFPSVSQCSRKSTSGHFHSTFPSTLLQLIRLLIDPVINTMKCTQTFYSYYKSPCTVIYLIIWFSFLQNEMSNMYSRVNDKTCISICNIIKILIIF